MTRPVRSPAAHEGQLKIAIHFRHGRGECVHVEEMDSILNIVLDDYPTRIMFDEFGSRAAQLIGQQKGRLFISSSVITICRIAPR